MTDRSGPSVCQLLADLHAYRVQTMPSADLQVNIDQRQLLEGTADRGAFVKAGVVYRFDRGPLAQTPPLDGAQGGGWLGDSAYYGQ